MTKTAPDCTKDTPAATAAPDDVPLVVDLDRTLARTDTLHETLLALIAANPAALLGLLGALRGGRAAFKRAVADRHVVGAEDLILNAAVVAEIEAARAAGRPVHLVSAADQRQAEAVSAATGLFDSVTGTSGDINLKGAEKARALTERFGAGGFDYIGDAEADLPVWSAARRAITVGAGPGLRARAEAAAADVRHIGTPVDRPRAMLRAMRPHQWTKNVLVFLPAAAAHDVAGLLPVLLAFVAFCLTASAIYVVNDLLDLAADRAHPRKRARPFAAGELSATDGLAMVAGLAMLAAVLALLSGQPALLAVLVLYGIATLGYSLVLKRKLIVDVLALAGLYTLRIIAGGVAAAVPLSPWMLGFSMFLFLALAAVKRQAELMDMMQETARRPGRAYAPEDLPILRGVALSSGHTAVLVLALYISSGQVQTLYSNPTLMWMVCPFLLYWILRMVMATHRGKMTDDPIVYSLTDRSSLIVIALSALLVGMAI